MNHPQNSTMNRIIHREVSVMTLAALLCAIGSFVALPAFSDDYDRGRHREHAHRRAPHRDYGYDHRSYGGYPPPIVYAPPVGISIVLPL